MKESFLMIGVGNPLRGDDGAGHFVCDELEKSKIENVKVIKVHQLQTELIAQMMRYDKVLIFDAAINVNNVSIEKVFGSDSGFASSHHTDAGVLKSLAIKLYNKDIDMYACAIPAFDFEVGSKLSAETKLFAGEAIKKIKEWIG